MLDPMRVKLQDRMLGLKRMVESVEQDVGGRLPDSHQAYIQHELHYGKIGSDMAHIQETFERPLQEHMSEHELNVDKLDQWLQLRHALERNAVIRRRTQGKNQHGSGFTDEALLGPSDGSTVGLIDQFYADNPDWQHYEEAAGMIDKLNRWSLDMKREHQIISDDDYASMTDAYEYWVPLRGFDDTSSYMEESPEDHLFTPTGRGTDQLKNTGPRYATGLKDNQNVKDILAWSFALARQTAVESRKNEVMLSFCLLYTSPSPRDS